MMREQTKQAKKGVLWSLPDIVSSVSFAVILCAVLYILFSWNNKAVAPVNAAGLQAGKEYLYALAENDPADVDDVLRERRQLQQHREEVEAQIAAIESDEVDIWSKFGDSLLLGDSRAEGFSFYNYLQSSHVLAETGSSIYKAYDHIGSIRAMQPSYIFMCYGINDVELPSRSGDGYAELVLDCISQIHEAAPNAIIVISSILPVTDAEYPRHSYYEMIAPYNTSLRALCDELPWAVFADNDAIAKEHMDLYEPDGIHVTYWFYPYWAKNMYYSVLLDGIGGTEEQAETVTVADDE